MKRKGWSRSASALIYSTYSLYPEHYFKELREGTEKRWGLLRAPSQKSIKALGALATGMHRDLAPRSRHYLACTASYRLVQLVT
jgi:hypothetical protein